MQIVVRGVRNRGRYRSIIFGAVSSGERENRAKSSGFASTAPGVRGAREVDGESAVGEARCVCGRASRKDATVR